MNKKCGAKTRSGGTCQNWGMENGRCRLHGGLSTGPPIITGRYSVKHRRSLAEKIQKFIEDPDPANLMSELALMRALLQDYLDRYIEGQPLSMKAIDNVYNMTGEIGKLVERINKILTQTALTMAEVQYLQARLADLVVKYIGDDEQRAAFWNEYRTSLSIPGRSGRTLESVEPEQSS